MSEMVLQFFKKQIRVFAAGCEMILSNHCTDVHRKNKSVTSNNYIIYLYDYKVYSLQSLVYVSIYICMCVCARVHYN